MEQTVTVILSPTDAELFKQFQQYYPLFSKLNEHKIFDIQFGKCTLNIAWGEVQNIVKEEVVWKR